MFCFISGLFGLGFRFAYPVVLPHFDSQLSGSQHTHDLSSSVAFDKA